MKIPGRIVLIGSIVMLGALTLAACSPRQYTPEQRAEWMLKAMTNRLDLNDQQQSKLRAIKSEFESSMQKYDEQRRQLFDRLSQDIHSSQLDRQLLMQFVETRKQAYDDIAPRVVDKIIDFHASLTQEQKKKLAQSMDKFREQFQKREAG